jgi:hypothetical protein
MLDDDIAYCGGNENGSVGCELADCLIHPLPVTEQSEHPGAIYSRQGRLHSCSRYWIWEFQLFIDRRTVISQLESQLI